MLGATKIEWMSVNTLIPYVKNARTHSDEQVAQIAGSIKEFGFNNPVLIDKENSIIAGHGRLMAARKLGMDKVPVVKLEHMTEAQRKAYVLADNRIALNSGWDTSMLSLELQELKDDIDLSLLGFDADELDALLNPIEETEGLTDEDAVPDVPEEPKTKLGDIYILGNHRLMCGDSTSITDVEKLMDGNTVDMVYTDPPYGISIVGKNGKVGGDNLAKNGVYAPVAGDDSINVAVEAIQVIHTLNPKVEIIWGGNYYANSLENKSSWIVWDKRGNMASNNFADCELAWCSSGTAARIYKQIWSGMIKEGEKGKRVHPTQKPIALAEWCYDQYGKECETVLDLFAGSGSSLIACETKKKQGFMMELSPAYCDVIVKRWEDFTGKKAVLSDLEKEEYAG